MEAPVPSQDEVLIGVPADELKNRLSQLGTYPLRFSLLTLQAYIDPDGHPCYSAVIRKTKGPPWNYSLTMNEASLAAQLTASYQLTDICVFPAPRLRDDFNHYATTVEEMERSANVTPELLKTLKPILTAL